MAETITRWQSSNGQWFLAGSWTNGIPSSADVTQKIAVFDDLSSQNVTDWTTGAAGAEPGFKHLLVKKNNKSAFGSSGSIMPIRVAAVGYVLHAGQSKAYWTGAALGSSQILIINGLGGAQLEGNLTRCYVLKGIVTIQLLSAAAEHVMAMAAGADILMDTTGTANLIIASNGGKITVKVNQPASATIIESGGEIVYDAGLLTGQTVIQTRSGVFTYNDPSKTGTEPTFILLGGIMDAAKILYELITRYSVIAPVAMPTATLAGPLGSITNPSPTDGRVIDLREEYP